LTHLFVVPVIVAFTKYDQFLQNVKMHMLDYPDEYSGSNVSEVMKKQFQEQVAEEQFQEHYLQPLGDDAKFVQLESGFRVVICGNCILMSFGRYAQAKESL
jgi:hypothetical protein